MSSLVENYRNYISSDYMLAVMPIARLHVEWSEYKYPHGVTFYPPEEADLGELNVIPNRESTKSLAEKISYASGIDLKLLDKHPLVVFPCQFRWNEFRQDGHRGHLKFIGTLSQYVDRTTLNVVRYNLCELGKMDDLPGRAGTVNSNPMMAGALLYNPKLEEARIIGGAVFSHIICKGLGLSLEQIPNECFPKRGQVGRIVQHALSMYTDILEASNNTSRFVQCMNLLEFLAYPDDFKQFKYVKKMIARYVATDSKEYQLLLDRFLELTGKRDEVTGQHLGYRTRIVHMGEIIEDIVPGDEALQDLFDELSHYTKCVIDHMIEHSELVWDSYLEERAKLAAVCNKPSNA